MICSYGRHAAHKPIDFLEGDVVTVCVEQEGHSWSGCIVPMGVDNKAFELSGEKGRSKAPRLNELLRELFARQVEFNCVLDFFWLSSADNLLADYLSRDRERQFLLDAIRSGFWSPNILPQRHPAAGRVRALPDRRGLLDRRVFGAAAGMHSEWCDANWRRPDEVEIGLGPHVPCAPDGNAASHLAYRASNAASVPYTRTAIYEGAPEGYRERIGAVLDNRFAPSSWRTIKAATKHWERACERHGWEVLIESDDP